LDGLDGAVARHGTPTAFGGYLAIVCDMAFYAAVPVGFALAEAGNAIWAALLLASFVCTCASFLGRAVMAARRGEPSASFLRPSSGWLVVLRPCASGPPPGGRWQPGSQNQNPVCSHCVGHKAYPLSLEKSLRIVV